MHYNLDAVIAVGYRVNSKQATHFRIWATQVLRDFIIKGFVLDGKVQISKVDADAKAISEYKEFNKHQKIESDFDREVKKMIEGNKPE